MTFVGNSPIEFSNIRHIKPLPPYKLADLLKKSDIFVIGSQNDPCSNSLIEALHCGLPAVARNSGGHSEIIDKSGELFNGSKDVIPSINRIVANYEKFRLSIGLATIKEVAKKYYEFMKMVYSEKENMKYEQKTVTLGKKIQLSKLQLETKLCGLKSRIGGRVPWK